MDDPAKPPTGVSVWRVAAFSMLAIALICGAYVAWWVIADSEVSQATRIGLGAIAAGFLLLAGVADVMDRRSRH